MNELDQKIGHCVERGKINKASPYPGDLKGQDGADELALQALESGSNPSDILLACNQGMQRVGEKFSRNEVFVPEMLMASKAMNAVLAHLKPFFKSGSVKTKGKFIIGTVAGDLHDIGKNLVAMFVEGSGWEVIDLGVDVKSVKFLDIINKHPGCVVGLSALLTTTMMSMSNTVKDIKTQFPNIWIIVGGAPLSTKTAEEMGADGYGRDPQGAVDWLNKLVVSS